jgi:hypothetical protein
MNDTHAPSLWDSKGHRHFCRFCIHLHSLLDKLTCNAFPEGIPEELISGRIFHNKPMLGQGNDIVFAPIYWGVVTLPH